MSTSTTLVRRLVAVASVAAAAIVWASAPAPAESPDIVGWWHKAHQSTTQDPVILPALPVQVMPTTGIFVATDPSGPFAIGAVRYRAAAPAVLRLRIDRTNQNLGTPDVYACPAPATWDAANGGVWDRRPTYDCSRSVPGVVAADGASVSFALTTAAAVPGADVPTLSVAIVPAEGSVPFSVAFEHPGPESLVSTAGSAPADGPGTSLPSGPSGSSERVPPGQDGGSFDIPALDVGRNLVPSADDGGADRTPRRAQTGPPPVTTVRVDDERGQRLMAVGLLAALLGALWWFGARPTRAPRLLLHTTPDDEGPTYRV